MRLLMKRAEQLVRATRRELRSKASPAFAQQMQRFFKEPVRAHGWRTAEVRKLAGRLRREILATGDSDLLLDVDGKLFAGPTLEEAVLGVALLQPSVHQFGSAEFRRLERWLPHIRNWAACDVFCTALLGRMIAADSARLGSVFRWAKSKNRWHRRAAAVSLVLAARRGMYTKQTLRLSDRLLQDDDDMVQKAVGWLLKEASQVRRQPVVSYLQRVRQRAPRLLLRIACEKLPHPTRRRILDGG